MKILDHQFLQGLEDLVGTAIAEGVELETIRWGLDNYGLDLEGWKREIEEEQETERYAAEKVDELLK